MAKKQIKLINDLTCSVPKEFTAFLYAISLKDYPNISISKTILNRCEMEGWDGNPDTLKGFFSERIRDPFKDRIGDIVMGLFPKYKNFNHMEFLKKLRQLERDLKIAG
tara:strand:- start:6 stop:329 length:324 start_codon:yes stop_codon:yes gene_type:complete